MAESTSGDGSISVNRTRDEGQLFYELDAALLSSANRKLDVCAKNSANSREPCRRRIPARAASLSAVFVRYLVVCLGTVISAAARGEADGLASGEAALQTERNGPLTVLRNDFYQLTFDGDRGGALVEIRFPKSGHRLPVTMRDAMELGYQLSSEPTPLWLTSRGPSVAVLEVHARMAHPSVSRARWPRVIYRYTFAAGSPLVAYEVVLPEQAVSDRLYRLELLSLRFGPPHQLTATAGRFLLSGDDAVGLPTGVFGTAAAEQDEAQLTAVVRNGRLDGRAHAWTGERLRWTGSLFIGPRELVDTTWPQPIRQPAVSAASLQQPLAAAAEAVSRTQAGVPDGAHRSASLVAAEMLLDAVRETEAGAADPAALEAMLAAARDLATSDTHPSPLVTLDDSFAVLCNRHTGLLFRRDGRTAALEAIYHAGQRQNFLRPGQAEASFWRARFRDHGQNQWLELASAQAVNLDCQILRRADGAAGLALSWPAQSVSGEAVDVRVEVVLSAEDPLARWRIEVLPRSGPLGLWEVDFPVFEHVQPDRRRSAADYLAYPFKSGYLLEDPSRNSPPNDPSLYPGSAGWQFLAYWQGPAGLYCGAHDGYGHLKRFRVEPRGDGTFRMNLTHLPAGMGDQGTCFRMPYECFAGSFEGDWYDAAMIYREWLVQQEWFPQQTLFENDRLPRWFKESSLSYRAFTGSAKQQPQSLVSQYLRLQKSFDNAPATLVWYGWNDSKPHMAGRPDLHPAPGFPEIIPRLRQRGIEVMPYTCALLWDVRNPSFQAEGGEAAAMRTLEGEVQMARYGDQPLAMVSPAHPAYQDKMVRFMREALSQMDIRGVYFDMAGTSSGGIYMAEGEQLGGNARTLGFRELMRRYREEGCQRDPQFVVTMEGNADCYLDRVDGYIAFLSNLPIRMALYADYQRPYGSKDCEWEPSPVELSHPARQFAWGAPIGRIDSSDLLENDQLQRHKLKYYRQLVALRNAALPWLAYGRMLRPLTLTDIEPPEPDTLGSGQTLPHGVWRAPDGTVAFAFANGRHSVPATAFRIRFDPATYGIPADGSYSFCRLQLGEGGTAFAEPLGIIDGEVQQVLTVDGADAMLLLALPGSHRLLLEK